MKIFLAAPFKNKIINGKLEDSYKEFLLNIKNILSKQGHEVHLALEREKWGEEFWTDEDCTKKDYQEIKESEIILAYFDESFSGGVHIELGWASEMKKRIYIITNNKGNLCSLIKGLGIVSDAKIIEFNQPEDLFEKLNLEISLWKNLQ